MRWINRSVNRHIWMAMFVFFSACDLSSPPPPVHREWTEDVDLGDGKVIQVKRAVEFNESNSWSGDAYNAVETKATIAFTGDLASLPAWSEPLMAIVLYQDATSNEWVVVAESTSCQVWEQRGKPLPPYWEFRLDARGWREVPLSQTSIGKPANLLHRYWEELPSKHMTVAARRSLESGSMGEQYRRVVPAVEQRYCS